MPARAKVSTMNVTLQTWTLETILAWEERQELCYEFDVLRPVAMTGGTLEHDRIRVNLVTELNTRLAEKPCRVHGNSLKIRATAVGALRQRRFRRG